MTQTALNNPPSSVKLEASYSRCLAALSLLLVGHMTFWELNHGGVSQPEQPVASFSLTAAAAAEVCAARAVIRPSQIPLELKQAGGR